MNIKFYRYSVVTVFADDADAPHNARITYSLSEDVSAGKEHRKDVTFFRILNENSGEITLVNQIPSNVSFIPICTATAYCKIDFHRKKQRATLKIYSFHFEVMKYVKRKYVH